MDEDKVIVSWDVWNYFCKIEYYKICNFIKFSGHKNVEL